MSLLSGFAICWIEKVALKITLTYIMHFGYFSKFAADPSEIYNFQFRVLNYLKLSSSEFLGRKIYIFLKMF
jgi:hypothetical protein